MEKWIKSGNLWDLAALGPRAALGTLKNLDKIPGMISETASAAMELAASPQPIQEKPFLLAKEIDDKLARWGCGGRGRHGHSTRLNASTAGV